MKLHFVRGLVSIYENQGFVLIQGNTWEVMFSKFCNNVWYICDNTQYLLIPNFEKKIELYPAPLSCTCNFQKVKEIDVRPSVWEQIRNI